MDTAARLWFGLRAVGTTVVAALSGFDIRWAHERSASCSQTHDAASRPIAPITASRGSRWRVARLRRHGGGEVFLGEWGSCEP